MVVSVPDLKISVNWKNACWFPSLAGLKQQKLARCGGLELTEILLPLHPKGWDTIQHSRDGVIPFSASIPMAVLEVCLSVFS